MGLEEKEKEKFKVTTKLSAELKKQSKNTNRALGIGDNHIKKHNFTIIELGSHSMHRQRKKDFVHMCTAIRTQAL